MKKLLIKFKWVLLAIVVVGLYLSIAFGGVIDFTAI